MHKEIIMRTGLCGLLAAFLMVGCSRTQMKPSEEGIRTPSVKMKQVEAVNDQGWWFYADKIEPTKGKAGNHGAPLTLAFTFEISNPNDIPLMMSEFSFTVALDEFELVEVDLKDTMWIPGGKTNQLRAYAFIEVSAARLNLLVEGASKLKEKKMSLWATLENCWQNATQSKCPVAVKNGAASFKANGEAASATFKGKSPPTG